MDTDLLNFISIRRYKKGRRKIFLSDKNEWNIYQFFYDAGFRMGLKDGQRVLHRNGKIEDIQSLRKSFFTFLKKKRYTECPEDINHVDILTWYEADDRIKMNTKLKYVLNHRSMDDLEEVNF
ncbi:MAG: hypothetical protein AB8G22_21590 [Saprospiraceae bacterium]